jgi:hypothetical protein
MVLAMAAAAWRGWLIIDQSRLSALPLFCSTWGLAK